MVTKGFLEFSKTGIADFISSEFCQLINFFNFVQRLENINGTNWASKEICKTAKMKFTCDFSICLPSLFLKRVLFFIVSNWEFYSGAFYT